MGNRFLTLLAAWIGVALAATTARADYVLTPTSGGQAALSVAPGGSFTLDINLASAVADTAWSAMFNVDFAQPGLRYLGYMWSAPFETAGVYNHSDPNNVGTPIVVAANTYVDSYQDPGAVDVHFENFTASGEFTTGKVLSLSLEVPLGLAAGPVAIRTVPISIENEDVVPTTGATFTLDVTGPRLWSGTGADNQLSTAANWSNGVPTATDPMIFAAGPTQKNPTNGVAAPLAAVGGITFNADGYTLSGTSTLSVNGPITNNAPTATIDEPIALAAAGGVIDGGAASGNVLTISQPVSGSVGLTKKGAGKVILTQDIAYTGNTVVEAGTLDVAGLSNAGSTTVSGTLVADYLRQDALTINGGGAIAIAGSGTSVVNSLSIANGAGGFSWDAGGGTSAAAAVPEPGTLALLATGLLVALYAMRIRQRVST